MIETKTPVSEKNTRPRIKTVDNLRRKLGFIEVLNSTKRFRSYAKDIQNGDVSGKLSLLVKHDRNTRKDPHDHETFGLEVFIKDKDSYWEGNLPRILLENTFKSKLVTSISPVSFSREYLKTGGFNLLEETLQKSISDGEISEAAKLVLAETNARRKEVKEFVREQLILKVASVLKLPVILEGPSRHEYRKITFAREPNKNGLTPVVTFRVGHNLLEIPMVLRSSKAELPFKNGIGLFIGPMISKKVEFETDENGKRRMIGPVSAWRFNQIDEALELTKKYIENGEVPIRFFEDLA